MSDVSRRTMLGLSAGLLAAGASRAGTSPAPLTLRRGVNLFPWFSLTMEYPAPRTDYAWPPFQPQRPVPTPRDLDRLAATGLDFVRLPVDPGPFLAFAGARREALLADLDRAVGETLAAGLSILINLQPNEATHYWTSRRMVASLEAPDYPAYRALVVDVMRLLAGHDGSKVALEPVNEPGQPCGSPVWLGVQADLLEAARAAAPPVTLVASGSCGSIIPGLLAFDPAPLARFAPLIVTVHYYEPYLFTHQGAPWMREPIYRWLTGVAWPGTAGTLRGTLARVRARMDADPDRTPAEKAAVWPEIERVLTEYYAAEPDRRFVAGHVAMILDWGRRNGVEPGRILIGEFGALRSDWRYTASDPDDRARYLTDVRACLEESGLPWAFWNLFDGMGLMEDSSRALDPSIVAALGLRLPGRASRSGR